MKTLDPSTYYIYMTTDLINNKKYIGQHKLSSKKINYLGSGTKLKKEISQKGRNNFSMEIIDWYSTFDDALMAESYYIYNYDTLEPIGYNYNVISIDKVYDWLQQKIQTTIL